MQERRIGRRLLMGLLALAMMGNTAGRASEPPAHKTEAQTVLGISVVYRPDTFAEQIAHLKTLGVPAVMVRLESLPNKERWQEAMDILEASGMDWWLCLEGLPKCDGWVSAPDQFRLQGNAEGTYTVHMPADTPRTLVAVSPIDTPHLQTTSLLELSEGRAQMALGGTEQSVLLLYPYLRKVLPDLWEGWDRYRDQLFALLKARPPKQGFKGWVITSPWSALSLSGFPTSPVARAEWHAYLKARYPQLVDLETAWQISGSLKDHATASTLIPLWRGTRGVPLLVAPDSADAPLEVETPKSQFWSDYRLFLATRWQSLIRNMETALRAYTPEANLFCLRPPTAHEPEMSLLYQELRSALLLPQESTSRWRTMMVLEAFQATRQPNALTLLCLEGTHLPSERATLLQHTARELGYSGVFWHVAPNSPLSQEWWNALKSTDSPPESPQFVPFPRALWSMTSVQKFRLGWWVPQDPAPNLNLLAWGFETVGFWRVVEVQQTDKAGNLIVEPQVEIFLWSPEGEREVVLRRADRNPLNAFDLNGQEVKLEVRGEMVRFRLGATPVRLRGFAMLPYCESALNLWSQRVQELLKRAGTQPPESLKFQWENALEVYRKDREQGYALVRSVWLDIERAFQPYRWLEAEQASARTVGTIRADPALSGGASWVFSSLMPSAEYQMRFKVRLRVAGSHTLWLALRLPVSGSVEWQVHQEAMGEQPLAQGTVELSPDRATSAYADQFAWLPLGTFGAQPGDYWVTLRWLPADQPSVFSAEWDALLIAPAGITPRGILPPSF